MKDVLIYRDGSKKPSHQPTCFSGTCLNTASTGSPLGARIQQTEDIWMFEITEGDLDINTPIKGLLRKGLFLRIPCEFKNKLEFVYFFTKQLNHKLFSKVYK